ncbi:UNVERIFIED_CONTAM: hypothetical protein FKN15_057634 [Acipenser sinensis]
MEECSDDVDGLPFGDFVYIVAALLDPAFCLLWLEHDALAPDDIKVEVKKRVKDQLIAEFEGMKLTLEKSSNSSEEDEEPAHKAPRLFAGYRQRKGNKSDGKTSIQAELGKYLQLCADDGTDEAHACLQFWFQHRKDFPWLFQVAVKVLAIPDTSAPVERVFSHGGIIMHPHRSRLSATMLSNLIFFKCNSSL